MKAPPDPRELRSYRARSWLRAASRAESMDARFILCWVGLNSLYGQRRGHDWPELRRFLEEALRVSEDRTRVRDDLSRRWADVRDLLELEFLYVEYWSGGYTDSLGARITQTMLEAEMNLDRGTPEGSLPAVFERLYVLRNQILHGAATFGSSKNRDSLKASVPVLERLARTFCDIVRADEREARWGAPPNIPKSWSGHPRTRRATFNPVYESLRRRNDPRGP